MRRLILALCVVLMLAGCATVPTEVQVGDTGQAFIIGRGSYPHGIEVVGAEAVLQRMANASCEQTIYKVVSIKDNIVHVAVGDGYRVSYLASFQPEQGEVIMATFDDDVTIILGKRR